MKETRRKRDTRLTALLFVMLVVILGTDICVPFSVSAAESNFDIAGWIPYWTGVDGPIDAQTHIRRFDEIHPFGFSIKKDGSLYDLMGLDQSPWQKLFKSARSRHVLITPTITSGDGTRVQDILSNADKRTAHIKAIVEMLHNGGFDGVNIDYEGKRAETKDYFSLFLKELKEVLGSMRLSCTIEPRTPPDSLSKIVPTDPQYANDYTAIATYCDRVEVMAYDQRRVDIKLDAENKGSPYVPVADRNWVRKVLVLTLQSIPKEKLILGIPTYGHEYEVTVSPDWYKAYRRIRSINPDTAIALATKNNITPTRNTAGEMSFTYATASTTPTLASYTIPKNTSKGNVVAAQALAYANKTRKSTVFTVVSWTDVTALEAKVNLAKELGLAGVAFFKIDGHEDTRVWDLF